MTPSPLSHSTDSAVAAETVAEFGAPYDLPRTLGVLQRGHGDPAVQVDRGEFPGGSGGTPGAGAWMCQRIYDASGAELGPVSYRFDQVSASAVRVRIAASSEAAAAAAATRAPQVLGAEDDWSELELLLDALGDQVSTELARVRRHHPGLRLTTTGALFDQLVNVTLEQKVTHLQARHCWRHLLKQYGKPPPSSSALAVPSWIRLPLSAGQLKAVPSWAWHRLWVQPPLSATVLRIAERAPSIHRLGGLAPADADSLGELAQQLTAVPGVGVWTAAEALQRSHGAADLVAVGDYHLAHWVGEALTGRRADDAGMLELLAPYRPHRQRIIRLLGLSGFRMSRFGPRLAPEDHRRR